MRFVFVAGILLLGLMGGGCGGEEPEQTASWAHLEKVAGSESDELLIPDGPPPEEVVTVDLERGKGRPLERGDLFTVNWVSYYYSTGKVREDFWKGNVSFTYTYGVGDTVRGWEDGLEGLRAGGVREVIVPADLAYGGDAVVYLIKDLEVDPL